MRISLSIIFLVFLTQLAQGQIKNNSFENWSAISSLPNTENPNFWTSTNILDSTNISIFKSTDAYEGNFALKMIPKTYQNSYFINGGSASSTLTYGKTNWTALTNQGFYVKDTISFVPSKLAGYYKRIKTNYTSKDTAFVQVILNTNGTLFGLAGYGDLGFEVNNSYQYFEVNILSDLIVDSLGISFIYESQDTSANNGGYLLIDNLELVPTVSTHEMKTVAIKIYPNPTSDYLYFDCGEKIHIEQIAFFDWTGKLIKTITNVPQQLDVSTFPKGYYMMSIISNYGVATKKLWIK